MIQKLATGLSPRLSLMGAFACEDQGNKVHPSVAINYSYMSLYIRKIEVKYMCPEPALISTSKYAIQGNGNGWKS